MTKKILFTVAVVALLSGITVLAINQVRDQPSQLSQPTEHPLYKYREWGEIDAQSQPYAPRVEGNVITIPSQRIDAIEETARLFEIPYSREDAVDSIARRETLYLTALREGYTVSDEEIDEFVQLQIDMSSKASNLDIFNEYLIGYGMSLEEYWRDQRDKLTKDLLASRYLDDHLPPSSGQEDAARDSMKQKLEADARKAFEIVIE